MKVNQFIIHRLEKDAHKPAVLKKRTSASEITGRVIRFSNEIRTAYRTSGVKFGSFDQNVTTYPFQTLVRNYLDGKLEFVAMTHIAVDHLKTLADQKSASKGGYVVFSHYQDENEFLSVMVLNDKSGHAVDNKTLDLIESVHLEVDKVHVASALNISRWNSNQDPYLSFVEGSRDLSAFFLDFVGCTTLTSSLQQSRGLSAAVKDYLAATGIKNEAYDAKLIQIYEYCESQVRQSQPIYLSGIAALMEPRDPSKFIQFARDPNYNVDESFNGNLRVLKAMTRISYSGSDFRISFDHSALTEGRISYNQQRNILVIKDVPEVLRNQLIPDAP